MDALQSIFIAIGWAAAGVLAILFAITIWRSWRKP